MSFDDLPDDWSTRPLTDSRLVADVLDLVVSERDRVQQCVAVLVCDDDDRLLAPLVVEQVKGVDRPALMRDIVGMLSASLDEGLPGGSLVVAFGRRDGLSVTEADLLCRDTLLEALEATPWRLSSAHVITLGGSRAIAA